MKEDQSRPQEASSESGTASCVSVQLVLVCGTVDRVKKEATSAADD